MAVVALAFAFVSGSPGGVDASTLAFRFDEPFALTDSSGVLIAESAEVEWGEGEGWWIEPTPELTIGKRDGEEAYLLQEVRSVRLMLDGGVVLAEASDGTVRRFDDRGLLVWTAGGRGRGPGEFQCLGGVGVDGDGIVAWPCDLSGTGARYSLEGDIAEAYSVPRDVSGRVVGAYSDGDFLLWNYLPGSVTPVRDRVIQMDAAYLRARRDGRHDTLVVAPYLQGGLMPVVDRPLTMPLAPRSVRTFHRDTLWLGFSDRFEVRAYDGEGRLVRIVRRAFEPRPVDQRWMDGFLDDWGDGLRQRTEGSGVPGPIVRGAVSALRRMIVVAPFEPAYSRIEIAKDGHLWVRRDVDLKIAMPGTSSRERDAMRSFPRDEPGHWDVFGPDGRWLGEVETPPSFTVHEIGEDYVLGVTTDELDVPFVVKYRLRKPGSGPS